MRHDLSQSGEHVSRETSCTEGIFARHITPKLKSDNVALLGFDLLMARPVAFPAAANAWAGRYECS